MFNAFFLFCACRRNIPYRVRQKGGGLIENRITMNFPDKVWVEYNSIVFAKDGKDIFASSMVYWSDRREVYLREDISDPIATWHGSGQYYITARWTGETWQLATDEGRIAGEEYDEVNNQTWIANDKNHQVVYGYVDRKHGACTSGYVYRGYSDVNTPYESDSFTIVQLDNQTITVGEDEVECIVWEYTFDNDGVYGKTRYWFAADSHIFIKEMYTSNRDADIETGGSVQNCATLYKVGVAMEQVLQSKDKSVPVIPYD